MCGIAGIFTRANNEPLKKNIELMIQSIQHRGPDDHGTWIKENIAFGHVRLAIQDLSPNGKQPMHSKSERYVIAFNGEIYNFRSIKAELINLGHKFIGGSDTEVMLAAIEEWGLKKSLECFEGMFAFSLWDNKDKRLYLCRDRLGEKPLFYAWTKLGLIWASELKALKALPSWNPGIRDASASLYFKYGYIPTPYSIYNDCYKLIPGSYLAITEQDIISHTEFSPTQKHGAVSPCYYWKLSDHLAQPDPDENLDYNEAVEELDQLLARVTSDQMISDVPYGAFLSGGIDSSLVASVMQSLSNKPINTFTIGFTEKDFNEAVFAKEISSHLGTNHQELYISSNDCLNLVPELPRLMDEPFADSSALPAYFVSSLARQHVTVCLSGDAGDELFCGYNRYTKPEGIWSKFSLFPAPVRILISNILALFPPPMVDKVYQMLSIFLSSQSKNTRVGLKLQKLSQLLKIRNTNEIYEMLVSYCWEDKNITTDRLKFSNSLAGVATQEINSDIGFINKAMAIDTLTYLPDDNLTKVDRTSMASSLETRLPLLNHQVVEMAWQLPLRMKLHNGTTKRILREILYKRVPRKLIERPKMGFSVPVSDWIRGPLRGWAEELLFTQEHLQHGLLDHVSVKRTWDEHITGRKDNSACLWNVLMFQSWIVTQ